MLLKLKQPLTFFSFFVIIALLKVMVKCWKRPDYLSRFDITVVTLYFSIVILFTIYAIEKAVRVFHSDNENECNNFFTYKYKFD